MDWQIRLIIIALGLVLVGWVVWDFKRKKKKQIQQQRMIETLRAEAESVDASGFDAAGVGSVRKRSGIESAEVEGFDEAGAQQAAVKTGRKEPEFEPVTEPEPVSKTKPEPKANPEKETATPKGISVNPEMVFSLIVQANKEEGFKGQDFMPLLLSQGLRHGDMGIFHRHGGAAGKPGPVIYSVANAVEPGYFDIQNIQLAKTPAFALFMTLPGPDEPVKAYEAMVRTARLLESELDGKLLDQSKSNFSEQTQSYQLEQINAWVNQHQQ